MTMENQAKCLHFVQLYAVADRIDLSKVSDVPPVPDISKFNYKSFLPSQHDHDTLKNFCTLIVQVLKKYVPFFKKFGSGVERHIQHQYSRHLATKSIVVS